MTKPITLDSLRKFNRNMGFLHFIQGALMIVLYFSIEKIRTFPAPILTNYLGVDPKLAATGVIKLVTQPRQIGDLPFGIFVAVFLLLSALAHLIIITVGNKKYNRDILNGINEFRWYEYALSSSFMIVLIANLFGVFDLGELIVIFVVNAAMNLFGLMMEQLNQRSEKVRWGAFLWGSVAGLAPWVVIVLHMIGNGDATSKAPWFVWAILGSYFFFFNTFPVNMVLQYKKVGPWKDYLFGEKTYITLSLVAKTVLAWLVFFGAMQPR